jgi:hypothetical protein
MSLDPFYAGKVTRRRSIQLPMSSQIDVFIIPGVCICKSCCWNVSQAEACARRVPALRGSSLY